MQRIAVVGNSGSGKTTVAKVPEETAALLGDLELIGRMRTAG